MHFHKLKPAHGWRDFLGEIGIIVIGVLIALGAEQVVEAVRWREEVGSLRLALDHELGRDLGVYAEEMAQRRCVDRNFVDLERFYRDSATGRRDTFLRPIGRPAYFNSYFSVWDERGGNITQHLPLDVRIKYSELYDEFRNNETVRLSEREVWRSLAQFDGVEPLDHGDRMRLRELLTRAEQLNASTTANYDYILKIARPLGVQSIRDSIGFHLPYMDDFCRPLLSPA